MLYFENVLSNPIVGIIKDILISIIFFYIGLQITNRKDKKNKIDLENENNEKDNKLKKYFNQIKELQSVLISKNYDFENKYKIEINNQKDSFNEIILNLKTSIITNRLLQFNDKDELFELGLNYINEKKIDDLYILIETKGILELTNPFYYFLKGNYFLLKEDFNEALILLNNCLPFPNGDFFVYNVIGDIYYKNDNYENALNNYLKSCNLDRNQYDICAKICECYDILNLKEEHFEFSNKMLKIYPLSGFIWNTYANSIQKKGNYIESLNAYFIATQLGHNNVQIYNNIGSNYQMLNKITEAKLWFEKAIAFTPNFPLAYHNLAKMHWIEKNYFAQKEILLLGLEKFNNNLLLKIHLAISYSNLKKDKEALGILYECDLENDMELRKHPNIAEFLCDLSYIYLKNDLPKEAEKVLRKSIQIKGDYFGSYYELAFLFYKFRKDKERVNDSVKLIEISLSKNPSSDFIFKCYFLLGEIYLFEKMDYDLALNYFNECLKIKSEDLETSKYRNIAIKYKNEGY